ncbi:MAG: AAA family ATPase [Polyangiales bacterium]
MLVTDLHPFVPNTLRRRVNLHRGDRAQAEPQEVDGAYVFFDVSGFTAFCQQLTRSGPEGTEQLSRSMTEVFRPIVDTCLDAGGDVLYFAGDGVAVLFPAQPGEPEGGAARRATAAALAVVNRPRDAGAEFELRVRASVGAGRCSAVELGGVGGRWVLFVDGPAVTQALAADARGSANAVTVSRQCRAALGPGFNGVEVADGFWRVTDGPRASRPARLDDALSTELVDAALRYLPPALVRRLPLSSDAWFAEVRPVTAVFVEIAGVHVDDAQRVSLLQRALALVQEEMDRVGGTVHSVLGDKGVGILCVLGLPPDAHEDDPARASAAALAIREATAALGVRVGVGIATGEVHCGLVGSPQRRSYEMYGTCLALAARLMQATRGDGVLACPRTRAAAEKVIDFGAPRALTLKGFAEPVSASSPTGRKERRAARAGQMVGRAEVLSRACARVDAVLEGHGGALLLPAEAGMGKSTLLDRVVGYAREAGATVLLGAADSMEARTPLYALRSVAAGLFGVPPGATLADARRRVEATLAEAAPDRAHLAPLLNALVRADIEETPFTLQLTGSVRAENLTALVVAVFAHAARRGPLVVAVEDFHWMDPASWSLCARLVDEAPGLLLVGTMRPMQSPPPEYAALTRGDDRERVVLEALDAEDSARVIARCLGVERVSPAVRDAVYAHSEGVPFFTEEVTYALRESGALRTTGGECELVAEPASLRLPGSVTGIITSRIDHLSPPLQLSLKVASVLGRAFTLAALAAAHPMAPPPEVCLQHAERLLEAALVVPAPEREGAFLFRHALTHETTYELLTASQRRSLHRAAAEGIERDEADLTPYAARLAEHWRVAEDAERAARYSGLAGEQAIAIYDSRTAINYLTQALELDAAARGELPVDVNRARWERLLGEAWYSVPDFDTARRHYELAYAYCGFPLPRFSARTPVEIARHVAGRYSAAKDPPAELRARCIEALQGFDNLAAICLWNGDRLGLLHIVFASDNIGRMGGASPEFAMTRNLVGYSLLLAGLRGVAERDLRSAYAMAHSLDGLLAKMVTSVFLGLSLTALAKLDESIPILREGWALSREFGAGLWRHRADFMLGEALAVTGQYAEAAPYFTSCVEISKGCEPHTAGFASAMWALCQLRLGAEATDLLPVLASEETGVPRVRKEKGYGMQLGVAIGVQMELFVRTGRYAEAYALAREEMDIVEAGDDTYSYLRGSEAHTQTSLTLMALWERRAAGLAGTDALPPVDRLRADARRSLKHLKRGRRTFPAVEPRHRLMVGVAARLDGDLRAAREELAACVEVAKRYGFPWEEVVASVELARVTEGNDRARWRSRAKEVAAARGLVWEVSSTPTLGLTAIA